MVGHVRVLDETPSPLVALRAHRRLTVATAASGVMRTAQKLNHVGLKVTGPRLHVLNVFHAHERTQLSADDINRWTEEHGARIALATIYRVLHDLTEVGILTRTVLDRRPATYALQKEQHHDHMVCRGCGRVDEFSDRSIARRSRALAQHRGFAVSSHHITLYGFCADCLSRRSTRA